MLNRVVAEEAVCEQVGGSVDSEVGERTDEQASIGCLGVVEACASERVHDSEVIATGSQWHLCKLLELSQVQVHCVAANVC